MPDALPPKTCSIDRLITNPADVERVLSGLKTATRRNGRYADVGEVLVLKDQRFVVTQVYRQRVSEMREEDFQQEGFQNQADYLAHIESLHGGMHMPTLTNLQVWVHEFSPVQG